MTRASQPRKLPAQVAGTATGLSKLIYQSRASTAFSPDGLSTLLGTAVSRNRREDLTGTLVFDQGRFLQWLEGPNESLNRVIASIRSDPRHSDLEILTSRKIDSRVFSGWNMRLAVRKSGPTQVPVDTLRADDAPLDALMSYPEAAPSLLRVIFGMDPANAPGQPTRSSTLRDKIGTFVEGLGFSEVFGNGNPAVAPQHVPSSLRLSAIELSRLFAFEKDEVSTRRVEAICRTAAHGLDDFVRLFGMTSEALGDLWHEDHCTEADIAVALSEMQIVYSRFRRHGIVQPDRPFSDHRVIVAQMPGDLHIVGSILKADLLRSRGWDAAARFPSTPAELVRELRDIHADALVIVTSRVSASPDQLDRIAGLITEVRKTSFNRNIVIVVGGRVFSDMPGAWRSVDADAVSDTPLALSGVLRSILSD